MNRIASRTLAALASTALAVALPITFAGPAAADRCQPEELVLGSGNSPLGDDTGPVCKVMDSTVYPLVTPVLTQVFCGNLNPDRNPPPPICPS